MCKAIFVSFFKVVRVPWKNMDGIHAFLKILINRIHHCNCTTLSFEVLLHKIIDVSN